MQIKKIGSNNLVLAEIFSFCFELKIELNMFSRRYKNLDIHEGEMVTVLV